MQQGVILLKSCTGDKKSLWHETATNSKISDDHLLEAAAWDVQDIQELNLGASREIAVREFPLKSGPIDYLLL